MEIATKMTKTKNSLIIKAPNITELNAYGQTLSNLYFSQNMK